MSTDPNNNESRAPLQLPIVEDLPLPPRIFNIGGGVSFNFDTFMAQHSADLEKAREAQRLADPFQNPIPATIANMKPARLGRPCVVENMYYQDVGHIVAPGGVGKTTLLLHHCVEIVRGGSIFGKEVMMCGPVVYISAEDDSDSLLSRLWQICKHLEQECPHDLDLIQRDLHIIDAAGRGDTKLTTTVRASRQTEGGTAFTGRLDTLITTLKQIDPVMVFIDPLVSFNGLGEGKVNDSEQAMIEAARRIVRQVGCGVIYVHHSGKALVRSGEEKQYSGRGGSALADGSRMVFTLENVAPDEWLKATGEELDEGESGLLFSSPKLTWCKPQPPVYIKRDGFWFREYARIGGTEGAQTRLEKDAASIEKFLREQWPLQFTQNNLLARELLPQLRTRRAVDYLKQHGKVREEKKEGGGRGGAHTYLRPVDAS